MAGPSKRTLTAALAVLRQIEERHADRSRWCQGVYARDAAGQPVSEFGAAISTCLEGVRLITAAPENKFVRNTVRQIIEEASGNLYPGRHPSRINDCLGYEAVRRVERLAVEMAEAILAEREGK